MDVDYHGSIETDLTHPRLVEDHEQIVDQRLLHGVGLSLLVAEERLQQVREFADVDGAVATRQTVRN